jgi:ribosomal protein S18 acetylase RimI-like enzyme
MNKLLEELKKKNIKTVHLTVSKDNEIAQNLYNKIGFKLVGENSTDYIMRYDL